MLQPVFKGFDINIQYLMQAQANHDKRHMLCLIRNPIFHNVVLTFVMSFSHSVLQIWLAEKKFARFATIPIILFDIFPIEIWSQTNILTMAF